MRRWIVVLCLVSCFADQESATGLSGGAGLTTLTSVAGSTSMGTTSAGSTSGSTNVGDESESSGGSASESTGSPVATIECTYPASDGGTLELMVEKGSDEQLVFGVPGLPDPSLVTAASLKFVSWDADHAGQEGIIYVNDGAAGIELPADAAWENTEHATAVVVTGRTVAGDNTVAFGAGSFVDGSFYRISQVALVVTAAVEVCPEAPDEPDEPAKSVQVEFADATYTQRGNWVLRCGFIPPYAYTANGAHPGEDCEDLYDPDGSSKGTATFVFADLAPAMYQVSIQSRHSANRNPKGALFIVDGEAKRVDQTTGSDVVVDVWGTKFLTGKISVVLDSSLDSESDSVGWVRLDPV